MAVDTISDEHQFVAGADAAARKWLTDGGRKEKNK